jgi:outer membrane protein OmpA-like peptidoglycan-associated protein
MQKRRLLALVFGLLLAFSGYAQSESDSETQSESKGSFFFSGGIYNGFFDSPIYLFSNLEVKKLFAAMASGNYEFPIGPGLTVFGLEAGYSSGSRFGGKGAVDFIPFDLSAAYVFPLATNFYIGPKLKIGGLGLLGNDWKDVVLMAGARLEAELRSTGFPFGLFVAGGIDIFPTAPEFATLPVIEIGLRFPRGKLKKSGSPDTAKNKDTGGSRDNLSGQGVPTAATATPGAATGTGTGTTGAGTVVGQSGGTGATQGTTGGTQNQSTGGTPATGTPVTGQGSNATQNQTPGAATTPAGQTPSSPTTSQGTSATQSQTPAAPATSGSVTSGSGIVSSGATGTGSATVGGSGLTSTAQVQNRNIILEDGKQGILNSIYFEPDTAVLIESYRPILDAVGRQLAADPGLKLLIRAYAANFGTADGRYLVSANRARFSRDFFTSQYGVSASRFNIEAFGADKSPIYSTEDWQSHRCVELILFRD